MKAQRRHDLRQSDLAKAIKQAPSFWQQSGGRYLLLLIAVLVVVILIRYRISSNRQAAQQAIDSLSVARSLISELRSPRMVMMTQLAPPGEVTMRRRQIYSEANNAIGEATRLSDDRTVAAEALVARGDLCWALATLPEVPGASTQPGAQVRDPRELISNAAEAYRAVVDNYSDIKHSLIAARFGLAAIAENQANWDAARQQYEAIINQSGELKAYKQLASERLSILPKLREPVILAAPATEPALVSPTTSASTIFTIPPGIAAPRPATTQATGASTRSTSRP